MQTELARFVAGSHTGFLEGSVHDEQVCDDEMDPRPSCVRLNMVRAVNAEIFGKEH